MSRKCVFCNTRTATKKSKEHFIPSWLFRMTGSNKRAMHISTLNNETLIIGINSFVLPACEICNGTFANKETLYKKSVEKIISGKQVSYLDISNMLEFIDKIRIGLWFMALKLNKNMFAINPKFGINSRVSSKDRILYIAHSERYSRGLQFSHISDPLFMHVPSFLLLKINNLCLISYSSDLIASFMRDYEVSISDKKLVDGEIINYVTIERDSNARLAKIPKQYSRYTCIAQGILDERLLKSIIDVEIYKKAVANKEGTTKIGVIRNGVYTELSNNNTSLNILSEGFDTEDTMTKSGNEIRRSIKKIISKEVLSSNISGSLGMLSMIAKCEHEKVDLCTLMGRVLLNAECEFGFKNKDDMKSYLNERIKHLEEFAHTMGAKQAS